LSEIQNDLSIKKTAFTGHYNSLVKESVNTRNSLITRKELLIKKYSASVDSINSLIEKNNLLIEANKIKLNNFNTLISTIDNKPVALINEKKHKKPFNQIIGIDYPIKIIFKDIKKQESYQLISIDNITGELLKIQEIQGNKKINKIYTDFAESNKLTNITRNEILLWTDSKIAVDANMANSVLNADINFLAKLHKTEVSKLDIEINTYDFDVLKSKRLADSTKLNELTKYYNIDYPQLIKEYNTNLGIEKVKDIALMETYNSALINFEKNAEYMRSNIEAEADKCFSWLKTEFNDPYSAIFEKYGLKTYPSITEKYPCAKIYSLTVRAKNGFGSYVPGKYLVVMIDGNPITATEYNSNYEAEANLLINLMLEGGCKKSIVTQPIKPNTAEERIPRPIMKVYDYKFFTY
jgi:hypothetical protein